MTKNLSFTAMLIGGGIIVIRTYLAWRAVPFSTLGFTGFAGSAA